MGKKKYLTSATMIEEIISATIDRVNAVVNDFTNKNENFAWDTGTYPSDYVVKSFLSNMNNVSVELYFNVEKLVCRERFPGNDSSDDVKSAKRKHDKVRADALKHTVRDYIYAILLNWEIHQLVNDIVFKSSASMPKPDYNYNVRIILNYLEDMQSMAKENKYYESLYKIPAFCSFLEAEDREVYVERLLTMYEDAHCKSKIIRNRYNENKIKLFSLLPALTLVYLNKSKGTGNKNEPVRMLPFGTRKRRVKLYNTLDPYVSKSYDKELDASCEKFQTYIYEVESNKVLYNKQDYYDDSLVTYRIDILDQYMAYLNNEIDKQGSFFYKHNLFKLFTLTWQGVILDAVNTQSEASLTNAEASFYILVELITLRKYTDFLFDPDDDEDWENRANTELISEDSQIDWFVLELINSDLSYWGDVKEEVLSSPYENMGTCFLERFFPLYFKQLTGFSYSEIIKEVMKEIIGDFNDKESQQKYYQLIDTPEYQQIRDSLLTYFGSTVMDKVDQSLDSEYLKTNVDYKTYVDKILTVLKGLDELILFENEMKK